MSVRKDIHIFLATKEIALAGVSRDSKKFSNVIYRKLKATGHKVFPVNPNAKSVEGDTCYREIRSLPPDVKNLLVVASSDTAVTVMKDVIGSKIERIWVHTGQGKLLAGMETEIEEVKDAGIRVITGYCPMMFIEPLGLPHKMHRFVVKLFGNYPE